MTSGSEKNEARRINGPTVAHVYRAHVRRLRQRAMRLACDGDAGEDVIQEAFLRALAEGAVSNERALVPWLYRVTTNLCLNHRRDRRRRASLLVRWMPVETRASSANDAALILETLCAGICAEVRRIAFHYYLDEMSQEEIARLLSVPRRTVGYRLEQFRDLIHRRLES